LWELEIKKEVPAGSEYKIESAIGSVKLIDRSRSHKFPNSYEAYRKTCSIEKNIKIFNDIND
jgi:hypothetical protein